MADPIQPDRSRPADRIGDVTTPTHPHGPIPGERGVVTSQGPAADQRTGSQTGNIGGGGADAHNTDPVRATGGDDATATPSRGGKKRTTKKY